MWDYVCIPGLFVFLLGGDVIIYYKRLSKHAAQWLVVNNKPQILKCDAKDSIFLRFDAERFKLFFLNKNFVLTFINQVK